MLLMSRRRRRKRHNRGFAYRIGANLVRVAMVVLVAVAIGYAFYLGLRWVADEAGRRGSGEVMRVPEHSGGVNS